MADVSTCLLEAQIPAEEQIDLFGTVDPDADDIMRMADEGLFETKLLARRQIINHVKRGQLLRRIETRAQGLMDGGTKPGRAYELAREAEMDHSVLEMGGQISASELRESVLAETWADMDKAVEALRTRRGGFIAVDADTNKALLVDLHKPLAERGEMGKLIGNALEKLRVRAVKAGGNIGKLADWGLPHIHNADSIVRAAGRGIDDIEVHKTKWVGDIKQGLDKNRSFDGEGAKMSDAEFDQALGRVFDNIVAEGDLDVAAAAIQAKAGGVGKSISNRGSDSRVLHFKSGEGWYNYAQKYGNSNVGSVLERHVDNLSTDIALMEKFGANPVANWQAAGRYASGRLKSGEEAWIGGADNMFDQMAGRVGTGSRGVGKGARLVRGVAMLSKFGGTLMSAFSDIGIVGLGAKFNGMKFNKVIGHVLKLPSAERRIAATTLGNATDEMIEGIGAAARFGLDAHNSKVRRATDILFRTTGLTPWSRGWKRGVTFEMNANFARHSTTSFDELPERLRSRFRAYDITAADWDSIRKADTMDINGSTVLKPGTVENGSARTKLFALIRNERKSTVVEPGLSEQRWTRGQAGNVIGELQTSFWQGKSFSLAILNRGLGRYLRSQQITRGTKIKYASGLVFSTTMLGAVSLQMKEVSKGRDPRPMDTPQFWAAAFLQGGGLGIIGDFFFASENRIGQPAWVQPGGMAAGSVYDMAKILKYMATSEPGKALDTAWNNLPFNNHILFSTLLRRVFVESLGDAIDDDYIKDKKAKERRRRSQHDQDYFWGSGEKLPERAPRLPRLDPKEFKKATDELIETFMG